MALRTWLITGANRGLGFHVAKYLQEAGHKVVATARNPADAAELKALNIQVEALDITNPDSVTQLAHKLRQQEGLELNGLLNNAGVASQTEAKLLQVDPEDFAQQLNNNTTGTLRVIQALLPLLKPTADGQLPAIVNVSSVLGSVSLSVTGGFGLFTAYGYRASKAGLNILTGILSTELKGSHIVTSLHPGWVQTDMGGSEAPLTVDVAGPNIATFLHNLSPADHGRFYDANEKKDLPW
jgi:NAD(P)-dependent dehydrogenase (short-subunit alcohol dehydrogenase family)